MINLIFIKKYITMFLSIETRKVPFWKYWLCIIGFYFRLSIIRIWCLFLSLWTLRRKFIFVSSILITLACPPLYEFERDGDSHLPILGHIFYPEGVTFCKKLACLFSFCSFLRETAMDSSCETHWFVKTESNKQFSQEQRLWSLQKNVSRSPFRVS